MVVNEEGKIIPLSLNLEASGYSVLITRRRKDSSSGDVLCGAIPIQINKIMDKRESKSGSAKPSRARRITENGSVT